MTRVMILLLVCIIQGLLMNTEGTSAMDKDSNLFRRLTVQRKARGLYGMSCTQLGRNCEFDEDCCAGLVCFSSYQPQGVCW